MKHQRHGDQGPGPLQGPRRAIPAWRGFYSRCRNVVDVPSGQRTGTMTLIRFHPQSRENFVDILHGVLHGSEWNLANQAPSDQIKAPRFSSELQKKSAGFYSGVKHLPGIELPAGNLGLAVKGKAVGEARPSQDKGFKRFEHFEICEVYGAQLANDNDNNCHKPMGSDRQAKTMRRATSHLLASWTAVLRTLLLGKCLKIDRALALLVDHYDWERKHDGGNLHMVYIYVQELATTPNKKATIGFKIPLFQMPSQYHSNVMPQLASPEVAEFFPPNKVLNWEAAKLLGFAGPSDPRLAAAAKANSNNKSLEFLEHFRTS